MNQAWRPAATRPIASQPSPWLWAALPLCILPLQYALRWLDLDFYRRVVEPEQGVIELATPALLLLAAGFGVAILRRRRELPQAWLALWFAALCIGVLYFAGEEVSWGQQLFGWATPESIARLNDQNETNLHNMSSWLDQKPRAALKLFVLVSGVLLPLATLRRRGLPSPWRWFSAGRIGLPSALLALLLPLPNYLQKLGLSGSLPYPFDIRASETVELLYALFLLLYLWRAWGQLNDARHAEFRA